MKTTMRKFYADVLNAMLGTSIGKEGSDKISELVKDFCKECACYIAEIESANEEYVDEHEDKYAAVFNDIYPDEWE